MIRHPRYDREDCYITKAGEFRAREISPVNDVFRMGDVDGRFLYSYFEIALKIESRIYQRKCCQINNYVLWSGLKGIIFTTIDCDDPMFVLIKTIKKNPTCRCGRYAEDKHLLFWDQGEPLEDSVMSTLRRYVFN